MRESRVGDGSKYLRQLFACTAALGLLLGAWASPARAEGDRDRDIRVQRMVFPVNAAGGTFNAVGYLYCRGGCEDKVLQVLQHGATYNHTYWDVPTIDGVNYSYARFMAGQGYAVLALDQLGTGESDVPDGDLLNLAACASVNAQVIDAMRNGANSGHFRFRRIVHVGHSMGAYTGVWMQATFHAADLLVATGDFHLPRPLNVPPSVFAALLANPYGRVDGAGRPLLFYYSGTADPAVEQYDIDHLADQVSRGLAGDVIASLQNVSLTLVQNVTGPVLEQVGEFDALFPMCTGLEEQEKAFWTSTDNVVVQVLPNIGHDLNLHTDNLRGWISIDLWIRFQLFLMDFHH